MKNQTQKLCKNLVFPQLNSQCFPILNMTQQDNYFKIVICL